MAGCGHLVSLATRMADLLAVAPYSAKASERPSLGLGRAWSRRHGKDGDRSARRLLCNLRQTDRPRGQADDLEEPARQFESKRLGRFATAIEPYPDGLARCR